MKFRKCSLRSVHTSSTKQIKNIELNNDEINLINSGDISNNNINNIQKQNTILNRLLLLQPKQNKINNTTSKKLSLNNQYTNNKYNQTFQKPDIENLIQQNIQLKTLIQSNNYNINCLRVKNNQHQKKFKFLQKGIQKYQKILQTIHNTNNNLLNQNNNNNNNYNNNNNINNHNNHNNNNNNLIQQQINSIYNHNNNKNLIRGNSQHSQMNHNLNTGSNSTGIVHTQILKKKISDLTNLYLKAQNQLKALKRLPNATIYQQNDIQKQHLIAQTVRLKAIVASLSNQASIQTLNDNNNMNKKEIFQNNSSQQKFQSHFMRLMKQQNQKLKSTIRLLQNDKILLKSRQTIMNKYNNDLKKQLVVLKQKLSYKDAEVQKLNNENKNLLFKKTTKYKQQQEKKQSQVILQLRSRLCAIETQFKRIQELNEFYSEQNVNLKQKQKNLLNQLNQIQSKSDKSVKQLNQQIQQLQFQLNSVKTDYLNMMRQGNIKKKKSIAYPNVLNGIGSIITGTNPNNNNNNNDSINDVNNNDNSNNGIKNQNLALFKMFNNLNVNNLPINKNNNSDSYHNQQNNSINSAFALLLQSNNIKKTKNQVNSSNNNTIRQIYHKSVKFQDIYLGLLHLYYFFSNIKQKQFQHDNNEQIIKNDQYYYVNIVIDKIIYKLIEDDNDIDNKQEYVKTLSYANQTQKRKYKKCHQLISLFVDQPFYIEKKQAVKLARYIVEDDSNSVENKKNNQINNNINKMSSISNITNMINNNNTNNNNNNNKNNNTKYSPSLHPNSQNNINKDSKKVIYNQNNQVDLILIKNILRSCLYKMHQKDNSQQYEQKWLQIINRNNCRKILQTLNQYQNGNIDIKNHNININTNTNINSNSEQKFKDKSNKLIESIKLDQLIELFNNIVTRKKIQPDDYQYLTIRCFDKVKSQQHVSLNINKITQFIQYLISMENNRPVNIFIQNND